MNNRRPAAQTGFGVTSQILTWGGVLLLVVGGVLVYPYVNSSLAVPPPTSADAVTISTVVSLPPTSTSTRPPDPSPTASTSTTTPSPPPTPTPAVPTRIVIPDLGVDAPVVPVSWGPVEVDGQEQAAWEVPPMYAAGWHETSAPLGASGNTVLNGHNTTNGEVFRDLYTLDTGEEIVVYSDETARTYTVSEVLILPEAGQPLEVRLENARYIQPTADERLTLVTCHPYGSLRNRLIVIAYPSTTNDEE